MKKKKTKQRNLFKSLIFFFVYMIVFSGITGVIITLYGPFENVKRTFVGTAMSTMTHQWLATKFLSQDKIDNILGKTQTVDASDSSDSSGSENLNSIKVSGTGDNRIEEREFKYSRFNGYILEIYDPKRLKVGYTKKLGIRGQTTSEIVQEFGGIAGVNGGGFTDISTNGKAFVGTGAYPEGIVISEGKVEYKNVQPKEYFEAIAFDKNGKLIVGRHTITELTAMGVQEALSFNKTLIKDGKAQVKGDGSDGMNPRTLIGQKQNGHILLVVIDGRSGLKVGATLKEAQDILLAQGAWNAANLDGGSSTTMYYEGGLLNNPCDSAGERTVATAFYITP